MPYFVHRILLWLDEPIPVLRIEIVRIAAPLAILGFIDHERGFLEKCLHDQAIVGRIIGQQDAQLP